MNRFAAVLLLVERMLGLRHLAVEGHRGFIGEKDLGLCAGGEHLVVGSDGGAEVLELFLDGGTGHGWHASILRLGVRRRH